MTRMPDPFRPGASPYYNPPVQYRRIQQLPPSLVNRIAAGEVIERPAAVAKELVENAIDAGANNILLEVTDGGRELIRVVDNGAGIVPGELPLAFASHATSKLVDDDDLFRIATMGFRGEALASIGAVSQARILSRTAASDAAYEIFNRGGIISDPQAAAGNLGTTVEVRDLFYNTPARRKFIKGTATEFGYISDTLMRLALPYPDIAFKLVHNVRTSIDLPATTAKERLLAAWPDDFRNRHLQVDATDAEVHLIGLIGLPEVAHPTAKHQYFYLNGRHIKDRSILHAVRESFRGLMEPGRYPAAILMLDLPPSDVDVNVHPTKIEVRFRDSGRIHSLVLSGLRERLLASDLTPSAIPMRSTIPEPARQDMRERLAEFFRQGTVSPPPPPLAPPIPFQNNPAPVIPPIAPIPHGPRPAAPPLQSAIQLHNSYLVAESDDGLIIIDQHALHERIMYEELLARITRGPLESQRLLLPQVFSASSRQMALLDQITPLLARLGIEVAPFGPDQLAVHAFPSFLERLDPAAFVRELLERGEQELLDLHGEELLHEVLDMMACKAAVKAGDPLTAAEIESLLARRELVERSSNCPHGRPTTLRLTLHDLEKQFKRTGF
jgi:DNA mismatch repair protein MutL